MLVLITLQNICQLLIHVWPQACPATQLPRLCVRTTWTVTSNFSLSALVPAQEGPEKDLQPD